MALGQVIEMYQMIDQCIILTLRYIWIHVK